MRFGTTAVLPSISWISIPASRLFSLNSDITSGFFSQSRPLLSIPLGLSREKIWRQTLFLCLVQIEINLCAVLSSTHGLICAFRGLRLGGFHPVPGTWIVREDLSLVQFELYRGGCRIRPPPDSSRPLSVRAWPVIGAAAWSARFSSVFGLSLGLVLYLPALRRCGPSSPDFRCVFRLGLV